MRNGCAFADEFRCASWALALSDEIDPKERRAVYFALLALK
jgi:hypothetical protein